MTLLLRGRARRGATLVEMLLALTVASFVAAAMLRTMAQSQQAGQRLAESAHAEIGAMQLDRLVRQEWRGIRLDTLGSDLEVHGDSLVYRAVRGIGVACEIRPASLLLDLESGTTHAARPPVPLRDSLLVRLRSLSGVDTTDTWWLLPLLAGPTAATCPGGGPAAEWDTGPLPGVLPLGPGERVPLAWVEVMEWRAYASGGESWFGARSRSAGEGIQPALGPLVSPAMALALPDSSSAALRLSAQLLSAGDQVATGASSHGPARPIPWQVTVLPRNR